MTQSGPEGRLDFFHDDTGNLLGLVYNGKTYYYIRNGQNDITGILDATGAQVVSYAYDSWGKLLSVTGDEAETIGALNPFRYRGYYYDSETALYYLNSRYYDPQAGRFINADFALGLNKDLISNNLFIYCSDNPITYQDPSGNGKIKNFFKKVGQQIKSFFTNIQQSTTVTKNTQHGKTIKDSLGLVKMKHYTTVSSTVSTPSKSKNRLVSSTSITTTKVSRSQSLGIVNGNVSVGIETQEAYNVGPPPKISISVQNGHEESFFSVSIKDTWNIQMSTGVLADGVGNTATLEVNKILFAGAVVGLVMCPQAIPVVATTGAEILQKLTN